MLPKLEINQKPTYKKISLDTKLEFLEIFSRIEAVNDTCFILESLGEDSYTSRYSIIGFDPNMIISSNSSDEIVIDGKKYPVDNPYESLREIMPDNLTSRNYSGGLVGYMSYESVNLFEQKLNLPIDKNFGYFKFGVFLDGLVFDKMTGELFYFYFETSRREKLEKVINSDEAASRAETKAKFMGHSLSKADHKKQVLAVKEEIMAGNTFQCEVGFKSNYEVKGDKLAVYKKLRDINPSPHMYYMKFGKEVVIGASPELLFRLRDGEMETFPLAGTTKRGIDENRDRELARELLNDPKEIAEHNMLIDLHRNDLGRVAKIGTVRVRRLMDIKKFSHVQHISSEIFGIIDKKYDMFSGLASVFPAGTLTGAPKIESMKIIARNENTPRGVYGGALGHFGFNGDATFAIPIRTLFISGDSAYAQTCGGIVYDSTPEGEYDEIERKLAGMKAVLDSFSKPTQS